MEFNLSLGDWIWLTLSLPVLLSLGHAFLRHSPSLVRYVYGLAAVLVVASVVLCRHDALFATLLLWGLAAWGGIWTVGMFLVDGGKDILRVYRAEGSLSVRRIRELERAARQRRGR